MYLRFFKRGIDLFLSILILILLFPFILAIFLLLLIQNNGKVFYFQERLGKFEKKFRVIKFKTMNDARDEMGRFLGDSKRVTKIGGFIRYFSFDEIPQLFNVLKGEMSLVGPRPFIAEYQNLYKDWQRERHNVRPGMTGWAQINGRNCLTWNEKFHLDVWYTRNVSFLLDVKIFLFTFIKIFQSKDVNSSKFVTMDKFNGEN